MISFPKKLPDGPHNKNQKHENSAKVIISESQVSLSQSNTISVTKSDFTSISSNYVESETKIEVKNFKTKLKGNFYQLTIIL